MEYEKTKELLHLLEDNCQQDVKTLAQLLDREEAEVRQTIQDLESRNIIVKYPAMINWEKIDEENRVTAMIDVKVTPQRDVGFDEVARRIYRFPEVKSVYLMSGAYDLSVMIEGRTLKEIAQFVSQKLSVLDPVQSTATHFLLKKYKHDGVLLDDRDDDKRMVVSP